MRVLSMSEAVGLSPADVLACVGAGGKTTTCWRLWTETRTEDRQAILTTTTQIFEPILPRSTALYLSPDPHRATVLSLLSRANGLVVAASRWIGNASDYAPNPAAPARPLKLRGLAGGVLDALATGLPGVTWFVEADGARGRGLKAPAEHEPVIPSCATRVVVIALIDSIGRPLNADVVHRPQQFSELLGVAPGDRLLPEHLVQLMTASDGGLKNVPAAARRVGLLSQLSKGQMHPQARSLADALLRSGQYDRVVSASLRARHPVLEVFRA